MKLSSCIQRSVVITSSFAISVNAFMTTSNQAKIAQHLYGKADHIDNVASRIQFLNATDLRGSSSVMKDRELGELANFDVSMLEFVPICGANDPESCPVDDAFELMKEEQMMLCGEEDASYPYVDMIRGSAPYIANHRGELVVIHVPGDLLAWDNLTDLMNDISLCWLLGLKIVVVVGCRQQVADRFKAMGIQSALHGHTRITSKDQMRIIEEEAGFARFEVERRLHRSLRCSQLSTQSDGNVVSGNFFKAAKFGVVDGVDFESTGRPRQLNCRRILDYLQHGEIVLMTSVGIDQSGEVLNVNSEALASFTAASLCANKLVFCSKNGTVLRHQESKMMVQNFRAKDSKIILDHYNMGIRKDYYLSHIDTEGLDPGALELLVKIGWSYKAIQDGVGRAHIVAPTNGALIEELFTARGGTGTCISEDTFESVHPDDHTEDFLLANDFEYAIESDMDPDWPQQVPGERFPWQTRRNMY